MLKTFFNNVVSLLTDSKPTNLKTETTSETTSKNKNKQIFKTNQVDDFRTNEASGVIAWEIIYKHDTTNGKNFTTRELV